MRKACWTAAVVLLLCAGAAQAAEIVPYSPDLKAGAVCSVPLDQLRPTQFCVGVWEVDQRAANIASKSPSKLRKYLAEHVAEIVIGPEGKPYLTDGHHLSMALVKSRVAKTVDAKVADNWRDMPLKEFWEKMIANGRAYLYDGQGRGPVPVEKLPATLSALQDDPYRSLTWAVRERGGMKKSPVDFSEFKWANYFRSRVKIDSQPGGFTRAIDAALKICHDPEAKDLPGYLPE